MRSALLDILSAAAALVAAPGRCPNTHVNVVAPSLRWLIE